MISLIYYLLHLYTFLFSFLLLKLCCVVLPINSSPPSPAVFSFFFKFEDVQYSLICHKRTHALGQTHTHTTLVLDTLWSVFAFISRPWRSGQTTQDPPSTLSIPLPLPTADLWPLLSPPGRAHRRNIYSSTSCQSAHHQFRNLFGDFS